MTATHDPSLFADAQAALREANIAFAESHPGEGPGRQPVHTVYGGAQLFAADSVPKLGAIALRAMNQYMADASTMGAALGIADHPALATIDKRVRDKLAREPIEDFRIDFEDGYGNRPDAEEDNHANVVAAEVAKGMSAGTLSPFIGMRVKPLNEEMRVRSIRTLDLVVTKLVESGGLPERWIVTIPKVTIIEQVEYTVAVLRKLEQKLGLASGSLLFELMVETPQIIMDSKGTSLLARVRDASDGRLRGAHFGTYDYIHAAWKLHFDDIRHSLAGGFYQGWDLHPAQLVTRYAALYSFFLEGIDAAGVRLSNFVGKAAQATLVGDVFDDAATGQGLLNFFLRGINSGAITEDEALKMTGLTAEEFRGRSFVKIMKGRK
jgi:hypothetical protein